jgi:ketosteroid isomerase-like protein
MTSSENIEIVRRIYQAVESGGLDAGAAFVHEDFEMTQLPGMAGGCELSRLGGGTADDDGLVLLVR